MATALSLSRRLPRPKPLIACVAASLLLAAHAGAATFWEPTPYLSSADIPAGFYATGGPTFLDTLEDGTLGGMLTANAGSVIGPGQFDGIRDSVDADDGAIDGLGGGGTSFFTGDGTTGLTFTFNGSVLPTAFALVWTDGANNVVFRATDGDGNLLGTITRNGFADGGSAGGTAEDRFFGVQSEAGIRSITISNVGAGIEVDHIQYGFMPAVPEPGSAALLGSGGLLLGWLAARRRRRGG